MLWRITMEKQAESTNIEIKNESIEERNNKQEWQKPELFLLDIENTLNSAAAGGDSVGRS